MDQKRGPRELLEIVFDAVSKSNACSNSPVWLEIETCVSSHHDTADTGSKTPPMPVADRHTNTALHTVSDDSSAPLRKGMEFSLVISPKSLLEHEKSRQRDNVSLSEQITRKEVDGLPDLCFKQDLCLDLHQIYDRCGEKSSSNMSVCSGILHKTKTFKHVLYQ